MEDFHNDDAVLLENAAKLRTERTAAGLDGLVGGLAAVVVNVAEADLAAAVEELLAYTGLGFKGAYEGPREKSLVLKGGRGADVLVKARLGGDNPFAPFNLGAKTGDNLEPRLETFIFACRDLQAYVDIQRGRGVAFMTPDIVRAPHYDFIQTTPSTYTGNSLGFVQWTGEEGEYIGPDCTPLGLHFERPERPHLANIGGLDHVASRVRAEDRDAAILEFMSLTNHDFDFSVYVESLNSITNVARLGRGEYAQVFTSGVRPFDAPENSGPTERFIHNYGARSHHMAFATQNIEDTVAGLRADGQEFLSDLVGSREEGLKQIFSVQSPNSLLVNEYIRRYDDFDGFFTRSNVTLLTKATEAQ